MKQENLKSSINNWLIIGLICLTSVLIIWARSELINADTAWHITLGEWILENKKVPTTDIFSQYYVLDNKTMTFLSHQWLTDIVFSIVHKIGKMNLLYTFMVMAIFVGHMYVVKCQKKEHRITSALILLSFSIVGFNKELWITPDTLAAVFLIFINYNIITWIKNWDKLSFTKFLILNSIYTLILANTHGGMLSANIIIQFVNLFGFIILYRDDKMKTRIKQSILLLTSTFLVGLINPHFIKIYGYGFMNNSTAAKYLEDWETFKFNSSIQVFVVGLIVLLAIVGIVIEYNKIKGINKSKSNIQMDILLFCMYAGMLFRYQRTLNIFTLAFTLYFSKYVYQSVINLIATINVNKLKKIKNIVIIIFIIVFIIVDTSILINKPEKNKTIQQCAEDYISREMVEYIKGEGEQARIFNTIECGGYLICLGIAPYIDGRTDPYLSEYGNQDLFSKSIKAVHSIELLEELTVTEKIDCLILRKNAIASQIVYASSNWEVKCESKAAVMFVRKTDKKGGVIKK